jgi:hypothetical protein
MPKKNNKEHILTVAIDKAMLHALEELVKVLNQTAPDDTQQVLHTKWTLSSVVRLGLMRLLLTYNVVQKENK